MKKILISIVVLMFGVMAYANAADFWDSGTWLTHTVTNTSGEQQTTFIPTTSIYTSDRIVGYEVTHLAESAYTNREMYATIYDSDGAAIEVTDEVLGECESITGDPICRMFSYPRTIEYGIAVIQGNATTVTIIFER